MPKGVTSLNIKNENGSFTKVPIVVKAENVKLNNGKNLGDSVAYLDTETFDSGIEAPIKTPLYQEDVVDHLYSSSSITPLSAAQGKVLQNEIDTLKTAGTIPSDTLSSEIIDIRNGANGKVYTSAGTAVRSQLGAKEDNKNKVTSKHPITGELLAASKNEKYPTINFLQQFYYENSQVDELIEQAKNQIGTAEWTELKDLRVGADGELYDNAGLSVRTNIQKVLNKIDVLRNSKLDDAEGSVATDNIASKAVTTDKIANGAITALKLANSAVSGSNIADNQISTNHLQSGTVTTDKLADEVKELINGKANKATTLAGYGIIDAYTKSESKSRFGLSVSVTFDENFIPLSSSSSENLSTGMLTNIEKNIKYMFISSKVTYVSSGVFSFPSCANIEAIFVDNSKENILIDTSDNQLIKKIHYVDDFNANNYIIQALLGKLDKSAGSVKTTNIASGAVTSDKIAGFAVTSDKIAYGAVGYPQLADNSINYEKLSDYAVHYENLQKGCINLDNFSDMLLDSYNQREVTWNRVSDKSKITDSELNYPSIKYLNEYYYDADEANNLLAQKYDSSNIETGSGSLTPYSSSVDIVKSADFTYQRVGRVVTVNINVVFNAGINNTVRFINLPFICKNTVNPRELCVTSEKAVHIWAINKDSAWLNIFSDSGVSFADGETLAFTISYLVS